MPEAIPANLPADFFDLVKPFYRAVLPGPSREAWNGRSVTSTHAGTVPEWPAMPQHEIDGSALADLEATLKAFPLTTQSPHQREPMNTIRSTLGAQACMAVLYAINSGHVVSGVPQALLPGLGEYHGVSAFTTFEAAARYGGSPATDPIIGVLWGQQLGLLPDENDNSELAVRVAVCYWEPLRRASEIRAQMTRAKMLE